MDSRHAGQEWVRKKRRFFEVVLKLGLEKLLQLRKKEYCNKMFSRISLLKKSIVINCFCLSTTFFVWTMLLLGCLPLYCCSIPCNPFPLFEYKKKKKKKKRQFICLFFWKESSRFNIKANLSTTLWDFLNKTMFYAKRYDFLC